MPSKILLLSHILNKNTPSYGDESTFTITPNKSFNFKDSCNTFDLNFNNHIGTHIDGPFHFNPKGKKISDYNITNFIFENVKTLLIKKKENSIIEINDILKYKNELLNKDFIIIKTEFQKFRNQKKYKFNNPVVSNEVIKFLQTIKTIKGIGIDCISISSKSNRTIGRECHKQALCHNKPLFLVEDMDLKKLTKNTIIKKLFIIPLLIDNIDSSPVTAFAEI